MKRERLHRVALLYSRSLGLSGPPLTIQELRTKCDAGKSENRPIVRIIEKDAVRAFLEWREGGLLPIRRPRFGLIDEMDGRISFQTIPKSGLFDRHRRTIDHRATTNPKRHAISIFGHERRV